MPLTIVIQGGGQSRRMGTNKALLPFRGMVLVERVYRRLAGLADEVLITANSPEGLAYLGLPLIPDLIPDRGALGGLYTALHAAANPYVFVVACDMPFINPRVVSAQVELIEREGVDVVIPSSGEGLEPLHAVYRREPCLAACRRAVEAGSQRLISWFGDVNVRTMRLEEVAAIDPGLRTFVNINTPEELRQAEQLDED